MSLPHCKVTPLSPSRPLRVHPCAWAVSISTWSWAQGAREDFAPPIPTTPLASFQPLPTLETLPLMGCPPAGHDKASSLEVTWPDGRVVSRAVASSETNSVLEIPYPLDVEEPLMPAPLEVRARCGCRL